MPCTCLDQLLAEVRKSHEGLAAVELSGHCAVWDGRYMYKRGQQAFKITPVEDDEWDEQMDGVKPVPHLYHRLGRFCQFCGEKYPAMPGLES